MELLSSLFELIDTYKEYIYENSTDDYNEFQDYLEQGLEEAGCYDLVFALYRKSLYNRERYIYLLDWVAITDKVSIAGEIIENPTYLDLCREAEEQIYDGSHIYLEGYTIFMNGKGIQFIKCDFGS